MYGVFTHLTAQKKIYIFKHWFLIILIVLPIFLKDILEVFFGIMKSF